MGWSRVRAGLLVIAVCWVVLFWRLGHIGLMDDEAHYARLTQEMAAEGNWLVPRLGGAPYIDKPVFFHWVQGLASSVVRDGELSARLPSAAAALALFAFVSWLGSTLGDRRLGRGAWLMLATIPATFLLGRTGYMDMVFTALLFGAVALITHEHLNGSAWLRLAAAACLAAAILTKGPVAAGLIGAWLGGLWLLGGETRRAVQRLPLLTGALLVGVLASPWFVWMYWQFGGDFVTGYFGQGHAGYFTPRSSASSKDWFFYVRMFLTSFFPWSLILIGYGIDTLWRVRRGIGVPAWEKGLWLWMALVLAAFTVVPFRVDRYIYPAAPACCLLAARGWLLASAEPRWREFVATRAAIVVVALTFVGAGGALWASLPGLALPLPAAVSVLPAFLVLGGLAMLASMRPRGSGLPQITGWPVATLVMSYAMLVFAGLPVIREGLPIEQVGRYVAERSGADEPVAVMGLDRWESGLTYYLQNPPLRLRSPQEAERFVSAPGTRWMVIRRDIFTSSALRGCVAMSVPAIIGTKGRGLRTQVWGDVVVVRHDSTTDAARAGCPAADSFGRALLR